MRRKRERLSRRDLAAGRARALAAVSVVAAATLLVGLAVVLVRSRGVGDLLLDVAGVVTGYRIEATAIDVTQPATVVVRDLSVAVPDSPPFLRAREMRASVSLRSLLERKARKVEITAFDIDAEAMPHATEGRGGRLPFDELALRSGTVLGIGRGALRAVEIDEIVLARAPAADRFDVRGALEAPHAGATLRWDGAARGDGSGLRVHARGELTDAAGAVRDLRAAPPWLADAAASFDFEAQVTGDLYGALRADVAASLRAPALKQPVRIDASVEIGAERDALEARAAVAAGDLSPLRARAEMRRDAAGTALEARVAWTGVSAADLRAAFVEPIAAFPAAGTLTLEAEVRGTLEHPRASVALEASRAAWPLGARKLTADLAVSADVGEGGVRSTEPLRVERVSLEGEGMTVALEKLEAHVAATGGDVPSLRLEGVRAVGLSARDDAGDAQAAGITLDGEASAAWTDAVAGAVKISAARGELLYRRAYLDLGAFPAALDASAVLSSNGGMEVESFAAVVERVGSVRGSMTTGAGGVVLRADATVEIPSAATPFDTLVRDTFADVRPVLAQTKVAGALEASVVYRRTGDRYRASGRARLRSGAVTIVDPAIDLTGVAFDVPFDFGADDVGGSASAPANANGFLRTGEVRIGGLVLSPVELPLEAKSNVLAAAKAITIPFAGGALRVAGLRLLLPPDGDAAAEAAVTVERMDLAALAEAADMPVTPGSVAGDLGRVTLAGGNVDTAGSLVLEVFGGRAVLSDIGMDNVTSPVPSLRLELEAVDLDLRAATETFGIGYVSGVARARVQDLEIAAGQPVSFDATFETVPTRGVPQRVSVAAIDQLTILGGADSGPIARGILGMFDEYRYAKMGFRCRLRNDRFILRGIEEHDGRDFLVVGTLLPPTVNVISHNQVIAFSEMVDRLKRISAVGEEPPTIR